jgi:endonuclease/exonuclease/phosphatase family metal-dependent hydrolase
LEDPKTIDTGGWKMPYFMKAMLSTPLGDMSVAALRGAYVYGKGGWLTTGRRERAVQYQRAVEVLEDDSDIAIIGGDMNSQPYERDHIFKGAGYELLTGHRDTWPDPQGIGLTNWRARMLARPFVIAGEGVAIDAFYGRGPIEGDKSETVATGLSDHLYLGTTLKLASDTIE